MRSPKPSVLSYLINEITPTSLSSIITADINLITLAWCGIGLLYVLLIFNFRETSAGGDYMEQAFYYRRQKEIPSELDIHLHQLQSSYLGDVFVLSHN